MVFTKGKISIAVVLTLLFLTLGGFTIAKVEMNQEPLFITNMSMGVNHESSPHALLFVVEQQGSYRLYLNMEIEQGLVRVSISNAADIEIFETTAQQLYLTQSIEMTPGDYWFNAEFLFDTAIEGYVDCSIQIRLNIFQ